MHVHYTIDTVKIISVDHMSTRNVAHQYQSLSWSKGSLIEAQADPEETRKWRGRDQYTRIVSFVATGLCLWSVSVMWQSLDWLKCQSIIIILMVGIEALDSMLQEMFVLYYSQWSRTRLREKLNNSLGNFNSTHTNFTVKQSRTQALSSTNESLSLRLTVHCRWPGRSDIAVA